jgi:hypothetical protein
MFLRPESQAKYVLASTFFAEGALQCFQQVLLRAPERSAHGLHGLRARLTIRRAWRPLPVRDAIRVRSMQAAFRLGSRPPQRAVP